MNGFSIGHRSSSVPGLTGTVKAIQCALESRGVALVPENGGDAGVRLNRKES